MAFRAPVDLAAINAHAADTLVSNLGIVMTEAGEDWLRGTMPVDARTVQPYGILHGGASVALAETLGSVAGNLCVDITKEMVVGLEINANHVRAMRGGVVTGTARAARGPQHAAVGDPHRERRRQAGLRVATDPGRRAQELVGSGEE